MSNLPKSLEGKINDPQVTHLDLSDLGLNDNDIIELQERLQNNQRITSLNLSNNNITHEGCGILALMTNIKKINLSHCDIGDKGVAVLVKTHINHLDVSYCGITEVGAKELQKNLKQYEALSIIGNPNIPNELLQAIRSKFVESTEVFSSPLGIDLGLNIHGSYEEYFISKTEVKKTDTEISQHDSTVAIYEQLAEFTSLFEALQAKAKQLVESNTLAHVPNPLLKDQASEIVTGIRKLEPPLKEMEKTLDSAKKQPPVSPQV